eukprot:GHVH01011876.1.p1 GENE.GHVH01011876.1~~GHVH01011876.1.p1  ORF type:complete len:344 (+),score=70.65 GHVH01011876.1:85-1116(+)
MPEKRLSDSVLESSDVKKQMTNCLEAIRSRTVIVADSADFKQLETLKARDGTTNPSLVLAASLTPHYKAVIDAAVNSAKETGKVGEELVDEACDQCAVAIGCEVLKVVPGVVSTEVDARLSFNTEASLVKARHLIDLYAKKGIDKSRVLIKMATTWESCQAAKVLEKEGVRTNMTLLFSFAQACAAAEAGAYLISPFVGRILDFHKMKSPEADFSGLNDPGVKSVSEIYHYYKKFGYATVVMGASFRSTDEVKNLAGCDRVTVSPKLLQELEQDTKTASVQTRLSAETASEVCKLQEKVVMDEKQFRWEMNEDEMATVKLSEGIRNFNKDLNKLKDFIRTAIN